MIAINRWAPPLVLVGIAGVCVMAQDLPDPVTTILAALSASIAVIGAVQASMHGLRPISAAFYVFWFAWLGVGPIAQLTLGRVAWGDSRVLAFPGAVRAALALTALAIACFWVGDFVARTAPVRPRRSAAAIDPIRHVAVVIALVVVGVNAIRVLGLETMFASRNVRGDALDASGGSISEAGGVVYALYTVLPAGLAIAAALLGTIRLQRRRRESARLRLSDISLFLIGMAGLVLFANPLSQTRFIALLAWGSLALTLLRPRSPRAGFVFVLIGAVATLVIYPLASAFRRPTFSLGEITAETFTSPDFDGFQQVVNTLFLVDSHGLAGGRHLFAAVLFFVPRSMWPEKARIASADVAEHAGYSFTNLSLPVFAELYLQFGVLGLIAGMLALGVVAARLDTAWLTAPSSKAAMIAPLVAVAMFGVLRGPLGAQIPAYLPAILILLFVVRSGRASESTGRASPRASRSLAGARR